MFSYVDEDIKKQLESDGTLVTIDRSGRVVNGDDDDQYLSVLGPIPMPRMVGDREHTFLWYAFVRRVELSHVLDTGAEVHVGKKDALRELLQSRMSVNSVLVGPGFETAEAPLVRIHSCCMTGDVFGSLRCECGPQLDGAFERIVGEGGGAVVYMSGHEGRGIGLWAKAVTYLLQDRGQDTYEANRSLGLPEDSRDFTDAAVVLRYLLKERPMRLLSNNPLKRDHLEKNGVNVTQTVSIVTGVTDHNRRYLHSKREKGHTLPENL